jgi:hypothetical protein
LKPRHRLFKKIGDLIKIKSVPVLHQLPLAEFLKQYSEGPYKEGKLFKVLTELTVLTLRDLPMREGGRRKQLLRISL